MRKKKILIIDHDPSGREALHSALPSDSFELVEAADSESGWRTFEKEQPELIILDIQLPQGQGFNLCQRIIQSSRLNRVPIVIVTDFGLETDAMLHKLSSLDIDFILPKPAPPKELLQTVFGLLGAAQEAPLPAPPPAEAEVQEDIPDIISPPNAIHIDLAPGTVESPPRPEPARPEPPPPSPAPAAPAGEVIPLPFPAAKATARRLILADDNPITRQIVQRTFTQEDFEITILTTGREVMDSLEKIKPDIILLDVNLPGKSGYEICEHIRNSPDFNKTAVIFLKEQYEKVDQQKLESLSWDDLIQKPIRSSEWVERVKKALAKKN